MRSLAALALLLASCSEPAAPLGEPLDVTCQRFDPLDAAAESALVTAEGDVAVVIGKTGCEEGPRRRLTRCFLLPPVVARGCDEPSVHPEITEPTLGLELTTIIAGSHVFFGRTIPEGESTLWLDDGSALTQLEASRVTAGPYDTALLQTAGQLEQYDNGLRTPLLEGSWVGIDWQTDPTGYLLWTGELGDRALFSLERDRLEPVLEGAEDYLPMVWAGSDNWICAARAGRADLIEVRGGDMTRSLSFPNAACTDIKLREHNGVELAVVGEVLYRLDLPGAPVVVVPDLHGQFRFAPIETGFVLLEHGFEPSGHRLILHQDGLTTVLFEGLPDVHFLLLTNGPHVAIAGVARDAAKTYYGRRDGDQMSIDVLEQSVLDDVFLGPDNSLWLSVQESGFRTSTLYRIDDAGPVEHARAFYDMQVTWIDGIGLVSISDGPSKGLHRIDGHGLTLIDPSVSKHWQPSQRHRRIIGTRKQDRTSLSVLRDDGSLRELLGGLTGLSSFHPGPGSLRFRFIRGEGGEEQGLLDLRSDGVAILVENQDRVWPIDASTAAVPQRRVAWGFGASRRVGENTEIRLCRDDGSCGSFVAEGLELYSNVSVTRTGVASAVFTRSDETRVLWRARLR